MDTPYEVTQEDEALYEMDDAALDAAFKEAKAERDNPEPLEVEEDVQEEVAVDETEDQEDIEIDETVSEDDTEQPDTDEESTDEDSAEKEEAEDDDKDENTEDTKEDDSADEDTDVQPEVEEEESKEEAKTDTFKVKANGMDFDFTAEELVKLAPKAMDYTKKMQEIAPYRKMISALKDNGYGQDDVNLMIDVLKGDKDAISAVVKQAGIDTLELDTEAENNYTPNQYGKSETELDIADVESRISRDTEYAITRNVVNEQWDTKSQDMLSKNPGMIEGLHNDIKNGVYDKVAPVAMKLKVLGGNTKSDLEYYMEAGQQLRGQEDAAKQADEARAKVLADKQAEDAKVAEDNRAAVAEAKAKQEKQKNVKAQSKTRKAAATTKNSSGNKSVIDYLDDNDEKFDEWYKKLNASI